MDTKEIAKALDRAFEQGTQIVNGGVDLLQSLRDALNEVDRLREALEKIASAGYDYGFSLIAQEALNPKETE